MAIIYNPSSCGRLYSPIATPPFYNNNVLSLPFTIGCGSVFKKDKKIDIKDDMVSDDFNIICIGELPEDDLEECYNLLKGIKHYSIPITHFLYEQSINYSNNYHSIITNNHWVEDRLTVYTNSPNYSDLEQMSILVRDSDVPCYLMAKDGSKIRIRGTPTYISYDIRISQEIVERWEIRIILRGIIE